VSVPNTFPLRRRLSGGEYNPFISGDPMSPAIRSAI
jgi:hypothetical protein